MDTLASCLTVDRRVALRAATGAHEIPGGWVVRHAALPEVFSLNLIVLTGALDPTVGAEAIAALSDRHLADLGHRFVRIEDAPGAERLAPALTAAGWERQRTLMMVLDEDGPPPALDPRARAISEEELDALILADFRATDYPPDRHPGLAERLVAAQRAMRDGTPALRFGAGEDGRLQSMATLFCDGEVDGLRVAMVEQVATLPSHRERGLAKAVVSAAVRAGQEWGADLIMVPADADDWPQIMYANLGFRIVGRHVSFLRRPQPRSAPPTA